MCGGRHYRTKGSHHQALRVKPVKHTQLGGGRATDGSMNPCLVQGPLPCPMSPAWSLAHLPGPWPTCLLPGPPAGLWSLAWSPAPMPCPRSPAWSPGPCLFSGPSLRVVLVKVGEQELASASIPALTGQVHEPGTIYI